MATQFDLAELPMEVFGLVLQQLFDSVTVRAERPTQLSRFNQTAKEDPQLSIFQVLNGDRHHLAKRKLLKLALFKFYCPCNPAASFSNLFKYLDQIHKLSVNYSDLYKSVPEPKTPYQYTNSKSKSFTPFQIAKMYTRRESLRVLKIKRTFLLKRNFRTRLAASTISRSLISGRLRRSINATLTAATTASRDGAGDFMKLRKERISDRCDVILELFFKGYWKNPALDITVSIWEGQIIALTSPFGEDMRDMRAELNAWFNSTNWV